MSDRRRWLKAGVASVLEHAFFSIANLVTGVVVARALGTEAFGVYAITASVIFLLLAVHHAVVAEPMIVLASTKYREQRSNYLGAIYAIHLRALPIVTGVAGAASGIAYLAGSDRLMQAIFGVTVSLGPTLVMTVLRRSASAELHAGRATLGATAYLVTTAGLLALLTWTHHLTIFSALATTGAGSLVTAAVYVRRRGEPGGTQIPLDEIMREHWRYGRPAIMASILAWVPQNLYILVLPLVATGGIAASADLRAAMNFISPAFQFNGALGIVLIPILSARHRVARLDLRQLAPFITVFLVIDGLILLVLVFGGETLVRGAYAGAYRNTIGILPILALIPLITGISTVLRAWALVLEFPEASLWSSIAGATGTLLGAGALSRWPLEGAAIGMLLAHGAYLVVVATLVTRRARAM